MSTQRIINTSFWDDPWIRKLDQTGKILYLYLLTNPKTNLAGIYEITDDRIIFDTGLSEESIKSLLKSFQDAGKVYRHGDWIVLKNWPKHQNLSSPKIQKGIERILSTLPSDLLNKLIEAGYKYPKLEEVIHNLSTNEPKIEYGYPIDTPSHLTKLNLTKLNLTKPNLTQKRPGATRRGSRKDSDPPKIDTENNGKNSDHPTAGILSQFLATLKPKEDTL